MSSLLQKAMINGTYDEAAGGAVGASAAAGAVLGSALCSVTTVQAFNMQDGLSSQFNAALQHTKQDRLKRGAANGLVTGVGLVRLSSCHCC
jgi:hypothetical protein